MSGDTLVQGAIIANAAGSWKAGKGSQGCTFETSTLAGYNMKAFRITTTIQPCSLETLELLFTTPNNNRLYEVAIESEAIIEEDVADRSRVVHTVFGPQGIVSARDFVTKQAWRTLDVNFSSMVEKILVKEGANKMFVFSSKSEKESVSLSSVAAPSSSGKSVVRGHVELHAFIGVPLPQSSGPNATPSVKLMYLSSVDPRGSIPLFAYEASWPENCTKIARVRDLAVMLENMALNVKRIGKEHLIVPPAATRAAPSLDLQPGGTKVATPPPAAAAARQQPPAYDVGEPDSDGSCSGSPAPQVQKERASSLNPVLIEHHQQQQESPKPVVRTTIAPQPAMTVEAKPSIEHAIQLFRSPQWTVSKTLDNCLLEEMPAPFAPTKKVLRISTPFRCSLGTFCEFLADTTQVRKYDPTLQCFDILRETPAGTVIYSSYQQQTRLISARDFCTITAKAELNQEEATCMGLPNCRAAYVQCSTNSTEKSIMKDFVRGIVHVFAYVALADSECLGTANVDGDDDGGDNDVVATTQGPTTIRVYNILCVDPSGGIPNWVLEAANAEACKKLALIRRLCEERQRAKPGKAPRRLSLRRASPPAMLRSVDRHTDPSSSSSHHLDETSSSVTAGTPMSSSLTEAPSFVDERDVLAEQDNLRAFYIKEVDEVIQHLVLLHCAKGWEAQKMLDDIKLETMVTPMCDKKAIKVSAEFLCSLETFQSVVSTMDFVRKYNPALYELETLESPPYGTVIYTSYKSNSKLVQARDFCTLTAAKLLSEEEGADAGLYTRGFRAAAYVISSINATDKPPQEGYVRGTVHAHGYIAVAVPPDAKRIRVFNVSLVDPNGSIPAKLVDAAVGDTMKTLGIIRSICHEVQNNGGLIGATNKSAITSPQGGAGAKSDAAESAFPSVDELPILRKLTRVHSNSDWQDTRYLGKVQISWAKCDVNPEVPVLKFASEFMCTLEAFARFVSASDSVRKCDPEVEVTKFLEGPPNGLISYVCYKPNSKLFPNVDTLSLSVSKSLTEEEGSELGLYTKSITSAAFAMNAIHWGRGMAEQPGIHRATVYYNGFIAIATPPSARRIRVFHYLALDNVVGLKGTAARPKEMYFVETANRLTRMAAYCEQLQRDMDDALKPQDEVTAASSVVEDVAEEEAPISQKEVVATVTPPRQRPQSTPPPTAAAAADDQATTSGAPTPTPARLLITRPQRETLSRIIALQQRRDWAMGKVIEKCLLETLVVDFCDKKAVRISSDFKCSLKTLQHFLDDINQVRVLDPTLDKFDVVGDTEAGVVIYTSYQQQSRLVAPRDFYTVTYRTLLSAEEMEFVGPETLGVPRGQAALIQNSKSISGRAPGGGKLVRGHVHVHGYFAVAPSPDAVGIKVYNISCADPGGSIPNWIIEAVNAEACKKLAQVRGICEKLEKELNE